MISSCLENFSSARILCVGDVMLDQFVKGRVSRISPEAPVPVLHIEDDLTVLGGAGNVVRNLAALGGSVTFLSVVGKDREGEQVQDLLSQLPRVSFSLLSDPRYPTTLKTRFVAGNQQILRADREQTSSLDTGLEKDLLKRFEKAIPHHDLVILSDYAKGLFSWEGLQSLIKSAKDHKKMVLVDPKGPDYSRYKGATLLTPNQHELASAMGIPLKNDADIVAAAQKAIALYDISTLVVTRGEHGITLVRDSGLIEHLPTKALEVFDVSGAGDTVISTLAMSLATGSSYSDAISLANTAAGLVVAKIGTAVVYRDELLSCLQDQKVHGYEDKIMSWEAAADQVQKWKRHGYRVVFTNGCFDLLHPGHVSLLKQAQTKGDRLIVGLNTDQSIKRLKGPQRPVQEELARAFVLASLECVDMIVLFDQDTPLELIQALRPNVLVKGADYTVDQVVGAPFVQSYGGEVCLVDLIEGHSTTTLIARVGHDRKVS